MPYFIKPSMALSSEDKIEAYRRIISEYQAICGTEDSQMVKMTTINCLLKTHLPYAYWVGFYIWNGRRLEVGPYQGTMGCIYIDLGKGVCGKAAATKATQLIEDCHALEQGTEHIACDPNSQSEIVVPVINSEGEVTSVLDLDSTEKASFDDIDKAHLERLVSLI